MLPVQSAARRPLRGFRRIGRHKVLRRHVVGEDSKISHTTTPDTQAGSVIIAKEGELCLKHTGFKLEVINRDPAQRDSSIHDSGCEHSFVPLSHIRKLDEYVKHAAGKSIDFERGLREVLQSDVYGNGEAVWRLEFENEGLNCSQEKHDEICKKLGITSFLELICGGCPSIIDSMPAEQALLHERSTALMPESMDKASSIVGPVELTELAKQDSAAKGFRNDTSVHEERPGLVYKTGKAIMAEEKRTASLKDRREDELRGESDTVSMLSEATTGADQRDDAYHPDSQLEMLEVLLEKSLERVGLIYRVQKPKDRVAGAGSATTIPTK
jgi:hypothetical protein